MRRYLPFLIVAAVALITSGSGFMLYRANRQAAPTAAKDSGPAAPHVRGEANAPVTLEEFGDFQCPPCSMMSVALLQLEKDYGSKLRVIFRHFPLANHAHAREAAAASEAAHMQGRFWEMHDLLYREQGTWSKAPEATSLFHSYAGTLGLDLERFKKDMQSAEAKARVTADHEHGKSRGVENTPTIFVNNTLVPPTSLNPAGLRTAIDTAIKEKSKL